MSKQILFPFLSLCMLGSIFLAGCSAGRADPPDVVDTWKQPEGINATSPVSCEQNRNLFDYDKTAPLDIREVGRRREEGVTILDLTYASPKGGRVPATLVLPDGKGPFAGILYQHGMPATRQPLIPGAVTYARMGAVVILIDAPFARPEHAIEPLSFTEKDRLEQIQLIVDLRRAVDLLLSLPEVDPQRLAYIGISYGGAMGGLLAGVENRLKGYVLQVGDGGLVTHFSGPEDADFWLAKPEQVRQQWVAWMWPIEPIHYVKCAAPAALLFQNGTLDTMVPPADALRYQQAGSEPKTVRWYKNGHGLGVAAGRDQAEWLSKTIGIASHRPIPQSAEISLTAWFVLTAGCLVFLVQDLSRTHHLPPGASLMWFLTVVFLGPLGLVIYWISGHPTDNAGESSQQASPYRRALGSAAWAAGGNVLGGIGVVALLLYVQNVFGRYLVLQIAATFLLPLSVGWLVFVISKWMPHSRDQYKRAYRRSPFTEVVSTCLVLVGLYPTVYILDGRWLSQWTAPFGFDMTYPPLWFVLCLGAIAGTLVAYPFHLWMLRRGLVRWGTGAVSEGVSVRGLAWVVQVALVVLALGIMLGAMFLAMQISQG